jgi:hypothetical protein
MKIKAYDKYHEQWLYIIFDDEDEMWDWQSSGPSGVRIRQHILFQAVDGDKNNCEPKRWSDLEQFKIIL